MLIALCAIHKGKVEGSSGEIMQDRVYLRRLTPLSPLQHGHTSLNYCLQLQFLCFPMVMLIVWFIVNVKEV